MKIHRFESTGDAYDACQTSDAIANGDVLVIESESVVGIADTWPVAVTEAKGHLHALSDPSQIDDHARERGWPPESVATARTEAAKLPNPAERTTLKQR